MVVEVLQLSNSSIRKYQVVLIVVGQPFYITMVSILFTIFSGLVVIGGFVVRLLAEQIFT